MALPEIKIDPEDHVQARSLRATIILRIGAAILGVFLGFAFFVGAYLGIVVVDSELLGAQEYVMPRLTISILLWTLLGLFTPFHVISQTFGLVFGLIHGSSGSGRVLSYGRLLIFIAVLMVILFVYWHILGLFAPVFGSSSIE